MRERETDHVFDVRVAHGSPGRRVAADGPRKQHDRLRSKAKMINGVLHHCVNGMLLLTGQRSTLDTHRQTDT